MAVDVTAEVEIARPRAEVAAFIEDAANDLRWIRALSEVQKLGDGPLGVGSRVRRVARFMGRTMPYVTEVVAYEPGRKVEMNTVEGPPMHVTYLVEDIGPGSTRISIRNQGGKGPLYAIAGPLIGRMVNSRVKGDLEALRKTLEA